MNSQETAPDNNSALGSTVTQQPTDYEWNRADLLPPVGCPLVICVDGVTIRASRISHLQSRGGQMDYRLNTGCVITGRYSWSYP